MTDGRGGARCPETGLAVPECSCRACLERMLHNFRPELLGDTIRVTRLGRGRRGMRDAGGRRRAA